MEKDKRDYLNKLDQFKKESQEAENENYISISIYENFNDKIKIEGRSLMIKYHNIIFEIYEELSKITNLEMSLSK